MSSTTGLGAAQRVTRASSRASSRAGSEGAPSVAEESNPSANPGRRGKTAATPKTARITNRSSGAYGARGKPQSAPKMSASGAANPASQEILSAVQGAQVNATLANNLADTLPPVAEERTLQPVAEERNLAAERAQLEGQLHPANQGDQFGQGQEQVVGETTFLDRFDISAILPRGMQAPRPVMTSRPVRGPEANQARRHVIIKASFVALTLLFCMLTMLGLYIFPLRGAQLGDPVTSSNALTTKASNKIIARVEKLENTVNKLASKSSIAGGPAVTHSVNWFAPGNGAVANPRLSSPVNTNCQDPQSLSWYDWLLGARCTPASYMPGQALRPWSEPDDFYCGAPGGGQLQLGVIIQRPVAPTELVIEHIPKSAAIHIGSAPKDVELWINIPDTVVRRSVIRALALDSLDLLDEAASEDVPERKRALFSTYIRVGRWVYNIWEDNHVQSFQIPIDLEELGVKTTEFAVRVYSNWADGGPVCIYRTLLHGQDMSGIVEKYNRILAGAELVCNSQLVDIPC